MISVTERARQQLKIALMTRTKNPEIGIRLLVSGAGDFTFKGDREKAGDHVVLHDGSKVLLADDDVVTHLGTVTIDCSQDDENPRFFFARA